MVNNVNFAATLIPMHDILLSLYAWTVMLLLQLLAVPVVIPWLRNVFPDGGWAFGRALAWLMIALPFWFLAHLKVPVLTNQFVQIALGLFFLVSAALFYRRRQDISDFIFDRWKLILVEEGLFATGFALMLVFRSHGPDILDLEKFMDAGLMASYLRSTVLPVQDMWFSGEIMNYYTFGHFLGSMMTRIWRVDLPYSYNLLLALVTGLTFAHAFALSFTLIHSSRRGSVPAAAYSGALIAALLLTYGGNTQTIWYLLKNHSWQGYWYPDATRFIPLTIHEFPSYSFVVSDLHAHVWGFPLVIMLTAFIFILYRAVAQNNRMRAQWGWAGVVGVLLGVVFMTNAWDLAIYSLLLLICSLSLLYLQPRSWGRLLFFGVTIAGLAAAVSSSWWLRFTSITEGIKLVEEGTALWQLLVVWGGYWLLTGVAVWVAARALHVLALMKEEEPADVKPALGFVIVLSVTAWLLIFLPELIYFQDIYTGHVRSNTMFKFTQQGFMQMAIVSGWLLGFLFIKAGVAKMIPAWVRRVLLGLVIVVFLAQMTFPFFGYRDRFNLLNPRWIGLNGLHWLKGQYPFDYDAILWLNSNVTGQPVILEAVGDSYSTFSRVSAFTGLPTVVGWPVHEWLWRGGFEKPGKRKEEVQKIYEQPLSAESADLLNQYEVEYVFVGMKERETYPGLREDQLRRLGQVIYEQGSTFIVQRDGSYISPESL